MKKGTPLSILSNFSLDQRSQALLIILAMAKISSFAYNKAYV